MTSKKSSPLEGSLSRVDEDDLSPRKGEGCLITQSTVPILDHDSREREPLCERYSSVLHILLRIMPLIYAMPIASTEWLYFYFIE